MKTGGTERIAALAALLAATLIASPVFCSTPAGSRAAHAAAPIQGLSSEFRIDPANPEGSIPTIAARNSKPLEFGYYLQDLVTFAQAAGRSGDHLSEARYYRAFTKAIPDSGAGFSRLCESLVAGGAREEAVAACRQALGLSGATVKDHVRFVHLILAKKDALTSAEAEDVQQVVAHLLETPETRIAGSHLQCELGVRIASVALLEACTSALSEVAPADPKTVTFEWALAVKKGDSRSARLLVARARSLGVGSDAVSRMDRATRDLEQSWWRRWLGWRALVACLLATLILVAVTHLRRRSVSDKVDLALGSDSGG